MKIYFYYWDFQCPLNNEMLQLLEKYDRFFDITIYNVKDNFEIARQQRMFFPTLTVVNDIKRYFNPLSDRFFESLLNDQYPEEKPYLIKYGELKYKGKILPLTQQNIDTAGKCTGKNCLINSQKKFEFLRGGNFDTFGFINVECDRLLGGVEYVPSIVVPYDIPKSENFAFLTCAYTSSEDFDYKTDPFIALEEFLRDKYTKIFAISDEIGNFPNGNLKWFLDNGFRDDGLISEEAGYCRLHLVSKTF